MFASDVDCKKAVENGINIMKERMAKKNPDKSNAFLKVMSSPEKIKKGVARCEQEIKTPEGKAEWSCQQTASTFEEFKACGK